MCLAIPGRIEALRDGEWGRVADVRFGGVRREVSLECVPEARAGDYVLVHVGFALSVIDEAQAQRTFEALRDMGQLDELDAPQPGAERAP